MSGLAWSHRYRQICYVLKRFLLWGGKLRPTRMYRRQRPIDPLLPPHERLFMRCPREWVDADRIKPAYIHFPDQSVNRAKYSRPQDVLLPDGTAQSKDWLFWGVAAFQVADVPLDSS